MWAWCLQVANSKEEQRIRRARVGVLFEEEGGELLGITGH